MKTKDTDQAGEFTDLGMHSDVAKRGLVKYLIGIQSVAIIALWSFIMYFISTSRTREDVLRRENEQTHRDYRDIMMQMVNRKNVTESKVDTAMIYLNNKTQ